MHFVRKSTLPLILILSRWMKGFFLRLEGRSDKSTSRSLQIWFNSSMVNLSNLSERTRSHNWMI